MGKEAIVKHFAIIVLFGLVFAIHSSGEGAIKRQDRESSPSPRVSLDCTLVFGGLIVRGYHFLESFDESPIPGLEDAHRVILLESPLNSADTNTALQQAREEGVSYVFFIEERGQGYHSFRFFLRQWSSHPQTRFVLWEMKRVALLTLLEMIDKRYPDKEIDLDVAHFIADLEFEMLGLQGAQTAQ